MQRPQTLRATGKAHPERPSASPLQAMTSALHAQRSARRRRRRTSRLRHTTHAAREMQRCGVASCCAQYTRCCALRTAYTIHAACRVAMCTAHRCILQRAHCCILQHVVLHPTRRAAGVQHRACCRIQHPMFKSCSYIMQHNAPLAACDIDRATCRLKPYSNEHHAELQHYAVCTACVLHATRTTPRTTCG
jgi:hypothetical protein